VQDRFEGVPVVVLSGYDDEQTAISAVQAGAQDYLVKGQVDDNVLVRSIRYAIERTRRHHAEEALRETSEEYRLAGEIQRRLFPAESPSIAGFDVAGGLYPAKATAGDYFDFVPMNDGCPGVVVGDVSGHGMGPALLMAETRACLRTLAQAYDDVGDILTRTNRVLVADTDDFHFVTLAMARIDPRDRSLIYASAGQRGYLLRASGDIEVLDSTSLPLGVVAETVVPTAGPLSLGEGDLFTFFTDGVNEGESSMQTRFGANRALEVILDARDQPARQITQRLYDETCSFRRRQPQHDDITIVVVKVTDTGD
jgi:sigma-B regulation protein RsbU (phosphoserine phosphatase)